MRKIMVFGIPGSGKSTFSVLLGDLLHLPVYHLDRHFFVENWKERDHEEFLEIQRNLVKQKEWIIVGNAIKSIETRFKEADVVIYFRFNRLLCLWRIFKRLFSKDHRICDRCEGSSERVRWRLIRYLWNFDKRVWQTVEALKERYPRVQYYEFRNVSDAEKFVQELELGQVP